MIITLCSSIIKRKSVDITVIMRERESFRIARSIICSNCGCSKCMFYCLYKVFMLHAWWVWNVSGLLWRCVEWVIRAINHRKGQIWNHFEVPNSRGETVPYFNMARLWSYTALGYSCLMVGCDFNPTFIRQIVSVNFSFFWGCLQNIFSYQLSSIKAHYSHHTVIKS